VLAEWVLIFPTLPPELLPPATIAALYRVRWQAELAIKRLKSLLDIDRLRAREHRALAERYLHGKRLYACPEVTKGVGTGKAGAMALR
jgi:hypothetical protein